MTRPLKRPLYDNIIAVAPDGEPLCRCNRDKADWYLSRGLAEVVCTDPTVIRLNFEPKGRGHSGDVFYLAEKSNRCVVCGSDENSTRHHIVPYCFRRHFPAQAKRHNSHDIVPMCTTCHDQYEISANCLKRELAVKYGVPFNGRCSVIDPDLYNVKRHASALIKYRDRIPPERQQTLEQTLRDFFKKDVITEEDIAKASAMSPYIKHEKSIKFGEAVMSKVGNLDAFVKEWRGHFIQSMSPKFMPVYWSVERKMNHE